MVAYVCQHLGRLKHGFPETFGAIGIKIKQEADDIRITLAALNNVDQIKITCVDRKSQLISYMAPQTYFIRCLILRSGLSRCDPYHRGFVGSDLGDCGSGSTRSAGIACLLDLRF